MSIKHYVCGLVLLVLLSSFGHIDSMAATAPESRAASALFKEFETVLYARGGLIARSGAYHNLVEQEADEFRVPFAYLVGGIQFMKGKGTEVIERTNSVLVGAKNFQAPEGLGSVRSQFCYILISDNRGLPALRKFFDSTSAVTPIGKPSVWTWSAKLGEYGEADPRPSSLYATNVGSTYILISNNLEGLESTANHLRASGVQKRDMSAVPDWSLVSRRSYWGVRIYRGIDIAAKEAAGVSEVTHGAKALSFSFDLTAKDATLRLLGSDNVEHTATKFNATGKIPALRRISAGVWQTAVPLTGDERSVEALFTIMGWFGFATYL